MWCLVVDSTLCARWRQVRAMKKPPAGVKLTMQATCIMFSIKPVMKNDPDNVGKKVKDYWEAAQKTILTDANKLLANLKSYEKDNIANEVIEEIEPFMSMAEFTPEVRGVVDCRVIAGCLPGAGW